MKIIFVAAIVGTLGAGIASMGPLIVHNSEHPIVSDDDKAFAWDEASGPKSERDAAALPLYQAVINGDEERLRNVLTKGTSANILLHPGRWSALMVAAALNERGVTKMLVEHGANVNYEAQDQNFPTPLAVALAFGVPKQDLSIFRDLIKRGADLNAKYPNGQDPAVHAAVLGHPEIVNELLLHGYRRDLPQLIQALEIIQVNDAAEPEKIRAIASVKEMLAREGKESGSSAIQAR